jgi:hypothetical protein
MTSPVASLSLICASNVHIRCLKECDDEQEKSVIINKLREDLLGMQSVTWIKLFARKLQPSIDQVTSILEQHNAMVSNTARSTPVFQYNFGNTLQNFTLGLQEKEPVRELDTLEELAQDEDTFLDESYLNEFMATDNFDSFFENFLFQ